MNKIFKLLCLTAICGVFGCAQSNTAATNQKILRENEQRLVHLENSISDLNSQIAQLNNRVYEVRNKNGQKTSMTVVPVAPVQVASAQPPASAARVEQPAAPQNAAVKPATPPVGKKINPADAPAPLQKAAPKVQPATPKRATSTPAAVAGANGQLGGTPEMEDLALPPTDLSSNPVQTVPIAPAPTPSIPANSTPAANNIPVPNIYAENLSLPPENTVETPPAPAQPLALQAPRATTSRASASKSEEAAYNDALRAARGGRINEALNLFRNFQQQYPHGKYTANAEYWIGECLYAQGKLQDALAQFQNVNAVYPTHHKNADALLKAGMTMNRLGDKTGAQEKYRTILSSFPNSDAAKKVRAMGIR